MRVDDFIDKSSQATSCDELVNIFEKAISNLGFDRFVYSFLNDHPRLQKKAQHGIVRSYPEDWMKFYLEKNLMKFDPTCYEVLRIPTVFRWKDLEKNRKLEPESILIMRLAEDAYISNGVSVSIHSINQEITGFGFASSCPNIDITKADMHKLHALANQFHLIYCDMFQLETYAENSISEKNFLTSIEREIILWCSRGKSRSIIAEILNISPSTVDFHLRNIFKKLEVNDRTVAVLKAYKLNIIDI